MLPIMDYVVVTLNDKETIVNTIDSIIEQNNRGKIIVIISDRSSDGTRDLVDAMLRDGKIDIIYPENLGLAFARELAIEVVDTEWFVFVDGDVELTSTWAEEMEKHFNYLQAFNPGMICGYLYRNEEQAKYLYDTAKRKQVTDRVYTHNTIVSTRGAKDWYPPEGINAYEDYLLTQYLLERGYTG